ncbi:MAG: cytochrome P450 [Hyphomonas sp.]|uniref:cytochrome P450 n=1 Tax=Hyphomonas sp. TaxID=87 RepID=UPI0034A0A665
MASLKLAGQDYHRAPQAYLAEALAAGPVGETTALIVGRVTAILGHAEILEFLKDTDRFAVDARNAGHKSAFGLNFLPNSLKLLAENLLTLDEPDHTRLRRLSDVPFRRPAIEALRASINAQCAQLLDEMVALGNTDLVTGLARPLPLQVICDLLGLSPGRRAALIRVFNGFTSGSVLAVLQALMKTGWVQREFRAEFAEVRTAPRPGLISQLVHAESEGGQLREDELMAMVFLLFAAGHETTTHLISTSVWTMLMAPGAREQVAAAESDALAAAVDEFVRYCAPVQLTKPRYARADTVFHGTPIQRGKPVMAVLAAGNLDPAVFEKPLTLNLARRPNRHLGWGGGPHICLGLHLAKAECEIALRQLLIRWPGLEIEGGPMQLPWAKRFGVRGLARLPLRLKV